MHKFYVQLAIKHAVKVSCTKGNTKLIFVAFIEGFFNQLFANFSFLTLKGSFFQGNEETNWMKSHICKIWWRSIDFNWITTTYTSGRHDPFWFILAKKTLCFFGTGDVLLSPLTKSLAAFMWIQVNMHL